MKKIKLRTCQGVGDIFWVYQKFAPHVDAIDVSITQVNNGQGKIGTRSVEFLKLLPKIGIVDTYFDKEIVYKNLAENYFPMKEILPKFYEGSCDIFNYGCNRPLEDGIRIEDIDPEYSIEETTDIKCTPLALPYSNQEYITVYVSGTTENKEICRKLKLWDVHTWTTFIREFYKQYKLDLPIFLIGASYDRTILSQLELNLKRLKFKTAHFIDLPAANVVYILKNTKCFIGYQSGLNILADNLNTKQVMIYFPFLKKMLYTWCKISNWKNGNFNAGTFDLNTQQIIEGLRLKF